MKKEKLNQAMRFDPVSPEYTETQPPIIFFAVLHMQHIFRCAPLSMSKRGGQYTTYYTYILVYYMYTIATYILHILHTSHILDILIHFLSYCIIDTAASTEVVF